MPALPLHEAGPYVAAAYLVFLGLILVYVGIMASKLVRIERQAAELNELVARRDRGGPDGEGAALDAGTAGSLEARGDGPSGPRTAGDGPSGPHTSGDGPSGTRTAEPVERP